MARFDDPGQPLDVEVDEVARMPLLMTDEFPAYGAKHKVMHHATINHQVAYADGMVHTNSIEGFWSLINRAYYGQHHHDSVKYMNLYNAEACYMFNRRKVPVCSNPSWTVA